MTRRIGETVAAYTKRQRDEAAASAFEAEQIAAEAELVERLRGFPGADGADGADGKDGEPGRDGTDGKDGMPGEPGKDGEPGRDGDPGKDGTDGRDGIDGKDGRDGTDGKDGEPGRDGVYVVRSEFTLDAGYRLDGMVDFLSNGQTRKRRVVRNAAGRPVGLE